MWWFKWINTKDFNVEWLNYKGWMEKLSVEKIEKMIADEKKLTKWHMCHLVSTKNINRENL